LTSAKRARPEISAATGQAKHAVEEQIKAIDEAGGFKRAFADVINYISWGEWGELSEAAESRGEAQTIELRRKLRDLQRQGTVVNYINSPILGSPPGTAAPGPSHINLN
jgi:hypothetical protein